MVHQVDKDVVCGTPNTVKNLDYKQGCCEVVPGVPPIVTIPLSLCLLNNRAFHRFGQAKFPDSGLVLGVEPIFNSALVASKNTAQFKSCQK